MALYIVRVELHGATEANYQFLHSGMTGSGFHRALTHGGTKFQLPSAEYAIMSDLSATAVKNSAKKVANSTGKGSWILVSQVSDVSLDLPLAR